MPRLRLALGQINPCLGDLAGNCAEIVAASRTAVASGADLVVFPEMALTGYPIEDLALRPDFLHAAGHALTTLAADLAEAGCGGTPVVVGFPQGPLPDRPGHREHAIAHNAAGILMDGRVIGTYAKQHLPNYAVFDEYRVFRPGSGLTVLHLNGIDVAVVICEDIWHDHGPVEHFSRTKPGIVVVLNGSPFERDKEDVRLPLVTRVADRTGAPVAYVNLVGGQDDLVFDGDSIVVSPGGRVLARSPRFMPDLLVVDIDAAAAIPRPERHDDDVTIVDIPTSDHDYPPLHPVEPPVEGEALDDIWNALVLGLRDYVTKNGFPGVLLGLSGGIDSAVCAAIAADAIGSERVTGVSLPSDYSSQHSRDDAADLARRLGIHFRVEPISAGVSAVHNQLDLRDVAAENLQARIRAVILMGISNTQGQLVLTTGNKTEIAVGYSTIYGDSVGGFAPIRDVPKTLVWELAKWRNAKALAQGQTPPIPESSITKPPSAELRPGQVDQDSLPDYGILDAILELYVTRRLSRDEVVAAGFPHDIVDRVIQLVDRSEWKRRQGAIGPKISDMSFGRDRRLPITYRPRA